MFGGDFFARANALENFACGDVASDVTFGQDGVHSWQAPSSGSFTFSARTTRLWVAFLLCNVIAQAGIIACGVGLIVSMTYGYAMMGALIAEYARITKNA